MTKAVECVLEHGEKQHLPDNTADLSVARMPAPLEVETGVAAAIGMHPLL